MYEKNAVLFVDDEINILQSIRRGLIDEEFEFYSAQSGQEAITILEQHHVDVVVTDMRMPEMNGLQLLRVISERWPKTVKIVLTGYTQLTQVITTINQVDIFKFLTKPWQIEELIAVVRKALDQYIMLEENATYKQKLESQNKTYQILLRRFDEAVSNSKFNTDFLGLCGKALFDFGRDLLPEDRDRASNLLEMRGDLYANFSKAMTMEVSSLTADDLNRTLGDAIQAALPQAQVSIIPNDELRFKIRTKLLETCIVSMLNVLQDEFIKLGLRVILGITGENIYSIIMQCPLGPTGGAIIKYDSRLLELKEDFLTVLLKSALDLSYIDLVIQEIKDSLVIRLTLKGRPSPNGSRGPK